MNGENFNISQRRPRILVAPLEWGLGHATRCVPIINELLQLNCEVLIAAEKDAAALLKKEFPQLIFLPLRGYRMKYSRKEIWLPLKLLVQLPKIVYSIYNEHRWLKKIVKEHNIDAVLSDNRFGLYHASVPCIYITHQLTIETGNRLSKWLAQKLHYHFINRYTSCWVPDAAGTVNLAGKLSHPTKMPAVPVEYLGSLSRFEKIAAAKKYELLICLSGPEPQRTIFEELLLHELKEYTGKVLFIRGLPDSDVGKKNETASIETVNHLSAAELNMAIEQAELVISRSGYTTIMDLVKLRQKAILVPTPGQKEQEYLAATLMQQKIFYCVEQESFSLATTLKEAAVFPFQYPGINDVAYKNIIGAFICSLSKNDQ
jgi:uncharacterized protein (TIGR00661 family)